MQNIQSSCKEQRHEIRIFTIIEQSIKCAIWNCAGTIWFLQLTQKAYQVPMTKPGRLSRSEFCLVCLWVFFPSNGLFIISVCDLLNLRTVKTRSHAVCFVWLYQFVFSEIKEIPFYSTDVTDSSWVTLPRLLVVHWYESTVKELCPLLISCMVNGRFLQTVLRTSYNGTEQIQKYINK